jgi:hypothetical protein
VSPLTKAINYYAKIDGFNGHTTERWPILANTPAQQLFYDLTNQML